MTERPILFSSEMIRALLEGRKGQTRRIAKFVPRVEGANLDASSLKAGLYHSGHKDGPFVLRSMGGSCWNDRTHPLSCPHGVPGDRLWVRESHWRYGKWRKDGITARGRQRWRFTATHGHNADTNREQYVRFEAPEHKPAREELGWHKRVSLFMPRWASRITLELSAVRVERLNEISEADAEQEGVTEEMAIKQVFTFGLRGYGPMVSGYAGLWESLNGEKSWALNPFVWVETFKLLEAVAQAAKVTPL